MQGVTHQVQNATGADTDPVLVPPMPQPPDGSQGLTALQEITGQYQKGATGTEFEQKATKLLQKVADREAHEIQQQDALLQRQVERIGATNVYDKDKAKDQT